MCREFLLRYLPKPTDDGSGLRVCGTSQSGCGQSEQFKQRMNHYVQSCKNGPCAEKEKINVEIPFACWTHVQREVIDRYKGSWEQWISEEREPDEEEKAPQLIVKSRQHRGKSKRMQNLPKLDPYVHDAVGTFFQRSLNSLQEAHEITVQEILRAHVNEDASIWKDCEPFDPVTVFYFRNLEAQQMLNNGKVVQFDTPLNEQPKKFKRMFVKEWNLEFVPSSNSRTLQVAARGADVAPMPTQTQANEWEQAQQWGGYGSNAVQAYTENPGYSPNLSEFLEAVPYGPSFLTQGAASSAAQGHETAGSGVANMTQQQQEHWLANYGADQYPSSAYSQHSATQGGYGGSASYGGYTGYESFDTQNPAGAYGTGASYPVPSGSVSGSMAGRGPETSTSPGPSLDSKRYKYPSEHFQRDGDVVGDSEYSNPNPGRSALSRSTPASTYLEDARTAAVGYPVTTGYSDVHPAHQEYLQPAAGAVDSGSTPAASHPQPQAYPGPWPSELLPGYNPRADEEPRGHE